MKKILAIALVLTLVLSLSVTAFADDIKVAFSQIGQESDWRTANTDSIKGTIEGHDGWTLIYDDAQQKQENQIKALRNFITQGVDYILFTGVVETGWDEVLAEVNEAEIPLILIDRMPDCADKIDYVAAFGGDFVEEGRRQVAWAGEYLKSLGRGDEEVAVAIMEGTTGQAVMEAWLKSVDKIDVLIVQNDDMGLGAIDAIKAAGLVPGKDIIIVGCDSVKAAFEAIVAGEMNCTVECTPLYGPFVEKTIEALEAGETFDKTILHPEEGVYDCVGGIDLGTVTSVLAADVIDSRVY